MSSTSEASVAGFFFFGVSSIGRNGKKAEQKKLK
jgi:hypothetical protein